VGHKLLLCHIHRHTFGGVLPPSCFSPNGSSAKAGGTQDGLFPPYCESRESPPPPLLSVTPGIQSAGLLEGPDEAPVILYLPLNWKSPCPVPPMRKHLPVDAVAHRTIRFTLGLSRMPMINSHLVHPTPTLPPQSLMNNTYSVLKKGIREKMHKGWASLFPPPGYYLHTPTVSPRPFMGLGKFVAGRIHQMRAGKRYLAAHRTWRSPDADTSCPRCGLEPETFEHAILSCPSRQHSRSGILRGVTDVGPEA